MSQPTQSITAAEVEEGHFLVALDNGYVHSDPDVGEYETTIEFHDRNGDECSLTVPNDHPLLVKEA